jgi:fusion and transport protein UGO1
MAISVYDEKNRPIHQMAPIEGGGVLEILGLIVKQPTEGWTSLFKGKSLLSFLNLQQKMLIYII